MIRFALSIVLTATITLSAIASDTPPSPTDWPQWRGPHRDGVSDETGWSATWPKEGPKVLWNAVLGTGFAAVAVSRGRVYTMGNVNNEDIVWCLDAATGSVVWKYAYKCELEPKSHPGGPGATPAVDGKFVYTMSKNAQINCIDAETGKLKWSKDAVADFGATKPEWAFSSSPLIVGDKLLVNVFASGIALNKETGELLWKGSGTSGYASPVIFKIKDGTGAAFFGKEALFGVNLADGKMLWEFPWKTPWGENSPDPIAFDDFIYISTGHGMGATLLKLSEDGKPAPVWENKAFINHISTSVLKNGFLYGFSGLVHRKPTVAKPNNLSCVDVKTGEAKWTQPDMIGQITLAGGKLILLTTEGDLIVAEASPEKYIELARAHVIDSKPGDGKGAPKKCWTVPVLSGGHIYCRNASGDLVCLDVSK